MSAAVQSPLLLPPDRVRVINRSIRCFLFGLVGVVPWLGLGMVLLTFKLYRSIAAETGEQVKLYPLHFTTIFALILAAVCICNDLWGFLAWVAIAIIIFQFLFILRQYLRNAPAAWNPARHLMYLGLALANFGLVISTVLVVLLVVQLSYP